jgi:hypothetical protein
LSYANNALGANQLDELVLDASLSIALPIRLVVAQITHVAFLVGRSTVGRVLGVDCVYQPPFQSKASFESSSLTVRSGRGAAVGVVAKGVHMHTAFGVCVVTGDVP